MNYKVVIILIVCIAAVVIPGCTSTQNSVERSTIMQSSPASVGGSGTSYSFVPSAKTVESVPIAPPVPTSNGLPGEGIDQKIIKTADISLEVSNVTSAAAAIEQMGTGAGGYVSTTNIGTDYNGQPTGRSFSGSPPPSSTVRYQESQGIGKVLSLSTQGQDVTEQYVDVQAQITAYQNQIAQYNVIMKNATKVEDVLAIQQQIDAVQTNLDPGHRADEVPQQPDRLFDYHRFAARNRTGRRATGSRFRYRYKRGDLRLFRGHRRDHYLRHQRPAAAHNRRRNICWLPGLETQAAGTTKDQ